MSKTMGWLLLLLVLIIAVVGAKIGPEVKQAFEDYTARQTKNRVDAEAKVAKEVAARKAAAERADRERRLAADRAAAEAKPRAEKYQREHKIMRLVRPFVGFMEKIGELYFAFDQTRFAEPLRKAEASLAALDPVLLTECPLASELVSPMQEAVSLYRQAEAKSKEASKFWDDTFVLRSDPGLAAKRNRAHDDLRRESESFRAKGQAAAERFVAAYHEAEQRFGPPPDDPVEAERAASPEVQATRATQLEEKLRNEFGTLPGGKHYALGECKWTYDTKNVSVVIFMDMWEWAASGLAETDTVKVLRLAQESELSWQQIQVDVVNIVRNKDAYGHVTEGKKVMSRGTWKRDVVNRITWPDFESKNIWTLVTVSHRSGK